MEPKLMKQEKELKKDENFADEVIPSITKQTCSSHNESRQVKGKQQENGSSDFLVSTSTVMGLESPRVSTTINYPYSAASKPFTTTGSYSTVNGSSSPPTSAGTPSPNNPDSVPPAAGMHLTQRQINKVRRFLTTLQQFATDISAEVGEKVHALILSLLATTISIEEFHSALQEVTHFPLRPFVLPFLKSHLPLLTREINIFARRASVPISHYIVSNEATILDSSSGEPGDFFSSESTSNKRSLVQENGDSSVYLSSSYAPSSSTNTNGVIGGGAGSPPPQKRPCLFSPPCHSIGINHEIFNGKEPRQDDEWKNIQVMLTCILSMVEKTRRALSILQQREDREYTKGLLSPPPDGKNRSDFDTEVKKYASDLVANAIKATEDRVAEVKRKAEEAVNEVRKSAVIEVQRAVAVADTRAQELVAAERLRIEAMLREVARREISGEQKIEPQQACWNCGRKAQDTCSGCSVAKYCGAFCQHKDWDQHHKVCGPNLASSPTLVSMLMNKNNSKHQKITEPAKSDD